MVLTTNTFCTTATKNAQNKFENNSRQHLLILKCIKQVYQRCFTCKWYLSVGLNAIASNIDQFFNSLWVYLPGVLKTGWTRVLSFLRSLKSTLSNKRVVNKSFSFSLALFLHPLQQVVAWKVKIKKMDKKGKSKEGRFLVSKFWLLRMPEI